MPFYTLVATLAKGIATAKSTEPAKVAAAMEGLKLRSLNGEIEMRREDHQVIQPLFIANWTGRDGKEVQFEQEKTGHGWKTVEKVDASVSALPSACRMKRPGSRTPVPSAAHPALGRVPAVRRFRFDFLKGIVA